MRSTAQLFSLVAAGYVLGVTPLPAQQTSNSGVQVRDGALSQLSTTQPDYANLSTRRLEVLTEIWGNVGLYHPVPAAMHLKWDDVLIDALRAMPSVRSDRDFVAMLNRVVFAPLHDPLTYAQVLSESYPAVRSSPAVEAHWLTPNTAYVSAFDPLGTNEFAPRVRAAIDLLARERPITRLVIDLRSTTPQSYYLAMPWLGMWVSEAIAHGPDISAFRTTEDPLGNTAWLITPWDSLRPIAPEIGVPTVFIVNRTAYAAAERALDAVRTQRKDVAVVLEQTGPIPILGSFSAQAWYPDSILLSNTRTPIISADGALGAVVDVEVSGPIAMSQLDSLAGRAIASRSTQPTRRRFSFTSPGIIDDSISLGPLTREQKLAGLLKTWFWVLHFYAYPEDITDDWRHMLATWVPKVEAAGSDTAYYRVLRGFTGLLNDTHVDVTHPLSDGPASSARQFSPPLALGWVRHHLAVIRVDTSEAAIGVSPGDEVIAVDGRSVTDLAAALRPYWPISRKSYDTPIWGLVMGPRNDSITLRIRSSSGVHEVALPRSRPRWSIYAGSLFKHPPYEILPGNLGFIDLGQVTTPGKFDSAMVALANTRGLLLDDRSTASYFAQEHVLRFISGAIATTRLLERITYIRHSEAPMYALGSIQRWTVPTPTTQTRAYTKPLVVMIGRADVSFGEWLAQELRISHRATFVGEPTNGTFGPKDGITTPGGAVVHFTRSRALWPDGAKYHGVGVVPDVRAEPTLVGLRERRDEVYEKALKTLERIVHER